MTVKLVFIASLLDVYHQRDSVKNKNFGVVDRWSTTLNTFDANRCISISVKKMRSVHFVLTPVENPCYRAYRQYKNTSIFAAYVKKQKLGKNK